MTRIPAIIAALYRGRQLADVETWKVAGTATAAVSGLLSALVGIAVASGWLDEIDPQTVMEVSSALVTLVSAALAYLQVATTEKIGVGSKTKQIEAAKDDPTVDVDFPAVSPLAFELHPDEPEVLSEPEPKRGYWNGGQSGFNQH